MSLSKYLSLSLVLIFSLSAKPISAQLQAAPQEWELNLETGTELRNNYYTINSELADGAPEDDTAQDLYAPTGAVSVLLRIPNLRAYYGLRLDGVYATYGEAESAGRTYTGKALVAYKAFLFDMEGDCDCPNWKKSNFFKKAFFVEFGLGYGRQGYQPEDADSWTTRNGAGYMARLGLALRLKKQLDVYVAAGPEGVIGQQLSTGRHSIALRPALGLTWRPYYRR